MNVGWGHSTTIIVPNLDSLSKHGKHLRPQGPWAKPQISGAERRIRRTLEDLACSRGL